MAESYHWVFDPPLRYTPDRVVVTDEDRWTEIFGPPPSYQSHKQLADRLKEETWRRVHLDKKVEELQGRLDEAIERREATEECLRKEVARRRELEHYKYVQQAPPVPQRVMYLEDYLKLLKPRLAGWQHLVLTSFLIMVLQIFANHPEDHQWDGPLVTIAVFMAFGCMLIHGVNWLVNR